MWVGVEEDLPEADLSVASVLQTEGGTTATSCSASLAMVVAVVTRLAAYIRAHGSSPEVCHCNSGQMGSVVVAESGCVVGVTTLGDAKIYRPPPVPVKRTRSGMTLLFFLSKLNRYT